MGDAPVKPVQTCKNPVPGFSQWPIYEFEVTFSRVTVSDFHLGYQRVAWKKLVNNIILLDMEHMKWFGILPSVRFLYTLIFQKTYAVHIGCLQNQPPTCWHVSLQLYMTLKGWLDSAASAPHLGEVKPCHGGCYKPGSWRLDVLQIQPCIS